MGGYDEEASRRRHRLTDPDSLCWHFAIRCHLSAVKRSLDHRRQCCRRLRNTLLILARADDGVNRATELRTTPSPMTLTMHPSCSATSDAKIVRHRSFSAASVPTSVSLHETAIADHVYD